MYFYKSEDMVRSFKYDLKHGFYIAGLLSWNVSECLVDLEKELSVITEQGLEGEEARYGKYSYSFL